MDGGFSVVLWGVCSSVEVSARAMANIDATSKLSVPLAAACVYLVLAELMPSKRRATEDSGIVEGLACVLCARGNCPICSLTHLRSVVRSAEGGAGWMLCTGVGRLCGGVCDRLTAGGCLEVRHKPSMLGCCRRNADGESLSSSLSWRAAFTFGRLHPLIRNRVIACWLLPSVKAGSCLPSMSVSRDDRLTEANSGNPH